MAQKRKLADTESDAAKSSLSTDSLFDSGSEHQSDGQRLGPAQDGGHARYQGRDGEQELTPPQPSSPRPVLAATGLGSAVEPVPLASVEHYPRKRISIAKCDAVRPTCGFCAGLGVQCQYRDSHNTVGSSKESRPRAPSAKVERPDITVAGDATGQDSLKNVSNLERRLLELESKWAELEKLKVDSILASSGAVFSATSPTGGLVVRPASETGAPPLPRTTSSIGMMSLPALLGGPSPPASTDNSKVEYGNSATAAFSVNGSLTADGLNYHHRQGSVTSSVTPSTIYQHKKRTTRGKYTARPGLLTFECPPYVQSESYDDSGEFYDSEMAAGDEFKRQMTLCLSTFPDVSKRTVRLVLQRFVENFLGWIPLFEPTAVYTVVNAACASGFAAADPNSCLAMLILATGSVFQNAANIQSTPFPGLDYFAHGSRLLERFTFMSSSLTTLHCRILQSAYFKLTQNALLSWNVIMQGTRDCMNMLSTRWFKNLDQSAREPWHRAFWACSIMCDEFEASLRMYTIGHRLYHEIVPLPRFENEDTGFYYFLAQISLRKLVCDALDVVGYHDGKVIYAPVVTNELRNQAREWYRHLPMAIRFPLDNSPLFDARKSFLRLQYISLSAVLEWASVLKVLEAYGTERENTDDIALARVEATECFRCCALYLEIASEQLLGWQLGTSISLWTTFTFVAMLIVTHKAPGLAFIPITTDESHIRSAMELLRPWDHVSYVTTALARMTSLMERCGITQ